MPTDDSGGPPPRRSTRNTAVSKAALPALEKLKTAASKAAVPAQAKPKPPAKKKKAPARSSPKKKPQKIKSAEFVVSEGEEDTRPDIESEDDGSRSSPLPAVTPSPQKPQAPLTQTRSAPTPPAIEVLVESSSATSATHNIELPGKLPRPVGDDSDDSDRSIRVRPSPSSYAKMHLAMTTPAGSPSAAQATHRPISPLRLPGQRSSSVAGTNGLKPSSMANAPSPHDLNFDDLPTMTPPSNRLRRAPLDQGGSPRAVRDRAAAETHAAVDVHTAPDAPAGREGRKIVARLEHELRPNWKTPPPKIIARGNNWHDFDAGVNYPSYRSERYGEMFDEEGNPRSPAFDWPANGLDITLGALEPSSLSLFRGPHREPGEITLRQARFLADLTDEQRWTALDLFASPPATPVHPRLPWLIDPPTPPPVDAKQLAGGPGAAPTGPDHPAASLRAALDPAASPPGPDHPAASPPADHDPAASSPGPVHSVASPIAPGRAASLTGLDQTAGSLTANHARSLSPLDFHMEFEDASFPADDASPPVAGRRKRPLPRRKQITQDGDDGGTMEQDDDIVEIPVIEAARKLDKGKGKAREDEDLEEGSSDVRHGRPSAVDNQRLEDLGKTIKNQIAALADELNINYATAVRKIGFNQQEVRSGHLANIHRMVTKQRLLANDERKFSVYY